LGDENYKKLPPPQGGGSFLSNHIEYIINQFVGFILLSTANIKSDKSIPKAEVILYKLAVVGLQRADSILPIV